MIRYFDGETWWFDQVTVADELGVATSTLRRWRGARVEGEALVRSRKVGSHLVVALYDVFYVLDNRERLFKAGVRLVSEDEARRKREYVQACQAASLDFAIRRGEEYTTTELREITARERSAFEDAVTHGRTYYGVQYARQRGGSQ